MLQARAKRLGCALSQEKEQQLLVHSYACREKQRAKMKEVREAALEERKQKQAREKEEKEREKEAKKAAAEAMKR